MDVFYIKLAQICCKKLCDSTRYAADFPEPACIYIIMYIYVVTCIF